MKRSVIPQAVIAALTNAGRGADVEQLPAKELFRIYLMWNGIIGFEEDLWEISYRLRLGEQNIFAHRPEDIPATLLAPMRDRCAEVIVDKIIADGPQDISALLRECRHELADYSPGYTSNAIRELISTGELEFEHGKYSLTLNHE